MLVRLTIDLTVALHFTFVLFVIFGGVLACKWRWVRWLHLPALVYGLLIEIFNWYCPLTLLEIELRRRASLTLYEGSFISQYVNRLVYIDVSQTTLIAGAVAVFVLNLVLYFYVGRGQWHARSSRSKSGSSNSRNSSNTAD